MLAGAVEIVVIVSVVGTTKTTVVVEGGIVTRLVTVEGGSVVVTVVVSCVHVRVVAGIVGTMVVVTAGTVDTLVVVEPGWVVRKVEVTVLAGTTDVETENNVVSAAFWITVDRNVVVTVVVLRGTVVVLITVVAGTTLVERELTRAVLDCRLGLFDHGQVPLWVL